MKTKNLKRPRNKKKLLIALAIVFVVVGAGLVYLKHTSSKEESTISQEDQESVNEANAETKQALIESKDGDSSSKDNSSGGSSNSSTDRSITLSPSQSSPGGDVVVLTKLYGYGDGTCTLTSTNSGSSDTQTAEVIYQDNFSSCAGFTVSYAALGKGTWSISLNVKSSSGTGTQTASVEVR